MIKLVGEKLRQYDLDRTVEITPMNGRTVEMVRFIRGRKPYMLAHREEGGKIIADIPNVLLKSFGAVKCIVDYVDADGHIVTENQSFYVRKREMPDGYSYTETDTLELGEGGGSASRYKQPDWGVEQGAEVFAESVIALEDGQAMIEAFTKTPSVGGVYEVNWNGTTHTCTVFEVNNGVPMMVLGNGIAIGGEDTGEPFTILAVSEDMIEAAGMAGMIMALDDSESVTLSITGESIHTIPEKFLENTREPFFVTFIPEQNMANKTYEQIKEAIDAMRVITLVCAISTENTAAKKVWCPLMAITGSDEIVFQNPLQNTKIIFAPDGTVRGES